VVEHLLSKCEVLSSNSSTLPSKKSISKAAVFIVVIKIIITMILEGFQFFVTVTREMPFCLDGPSRPGFGFLLQLLVWCAR
jgi:hypothetical protein